MSSLYVKKLLSREEVIEHVKAFTNSKLLDGIPRNEYHYNYKVICSTLFINGRHLRENSEVSHITAGNELLKALDKLDQLKTLNLSIGDSVSIISAQLQGDYVELWGFLTPKTITNIHYDNGKIKQVEFNNDPNDVYPREDNIEYDGKSLFHSAFFSSKENAEKALSWLTLKYPDSLKIVNNIAENKMSSILKGIAENSVMKGLVDETEAKKGADGKRCWKGKRYAGTENGKDKCIPVKEESDEEALERLKNNKSREKWMADADLEYMRKRHSKNKPVKNEAANPAQQAAIAISKKKKAKTNEGVFDLLKKKPAPRDNMRERLSNMSTDELRQELKDYKSRLSGARASGSLVGATVSDYVNAIQSELDKRAFNDFTEKNPDWDKGLNEFADDEKSEQPRREHPITIYIYSILHNKTITIVGEKLKRIPYGTYDQVHVEFTVPTSGETRTMWMPVTDKKYPTGTLSDNVYLSNSQKSNNTVTDGIFNYWAYEPNVNEGVIVGHDANDPEIAVLGGAGTMSLSRLKKKAQGEAEQLANDLARGRFKAAAYNIKQLENTLKTIVAAEDEMSKKYFGENAWNQLGQRKPNTNLPAPERGSRVNHGKRFEEGDIVLPLSGPLKGQPHKVIHSQRTSIRIVPLGRDSYPGDTIAPRTKHEWVVPADTNEDYTGMFAAEKTAATNPYGGQKDRQFRGAISEEMDEARAPHPLLKAANKNLVDLASGEVRRREEQRKAAEKAQRQASKDLDRMLNRKPAKKSKQDLQTLWAKIESVIANSFPDGEPYDQLWPYMQKHGFTQDDVERASKMNGYNDLWDYWNTLTQDIENDAYADWLATGGKNVRTRGTFVETPTDNPTGSSGEGGLRTYKPKSAGTYKESSIMKGLKR